MKRKLRIFAEKYRSVEMDSEKVEQSLYSWLGHAEFGNTYSLRKQLLKDFKLSKEGENNV